jgi:NAD(P)-dependent dehydrogenase (short-subunit alcohol dehydrogenase family)
MKVLIAGASGALGIPLTRALIAKGYEVLGVARSPESGDHLSRLGAHPIQANVMDRDDLLRAVKGVRADAVIHALTALKKSPLRHQDMYATNALRDVGTRNLLALARQVGARRFVAESMTLGYGYGDWGEKVITEDDPFAPAGSSSQLERHVAGFRSLERQLWEATREGWIEGIALRYGYFYGAVSLEPLLDLLRRRSLPLPDGGRAVTSWIYLEDAAAATVAALERGRAGEAYNIVDAQVDLIVADLSELSQVRRAASLFTQKYTRLHVLINNAGGLKSEREMTSDGLEYAFATNYLAPFLLTELLLDTLKASVPARIINVSSAGHALGSIDFADLQGERRYSPSKAYAQSKLAQLYYTYELADRLKGTGVTVNALHPGAVATNFNDGLTGFVRFIGMFNNLVGASAEKGAQTTLYLATSPEVESVSGKYFSKSKPTPSSKLSYDMTVRKRLWQVSEELTRL